MLFWEAVLIAVASLRSNKLRSFLTVLGILIGVSSVVAVVAITEGLDRYISDKVLSLGGKSFTVQKMPDVITSREAWLEAQKRRDIGMDDVELIKHACSACSEVGGLLSTGRTVKVGRTKQEGVRVMGITENSPRIGSTRLVTIGRAIIQEDIDNGRNVAVIGTDLVDAFFGQMEPLEREIVVDGHPLKVVGVVEKQGSVFGTSQDNFLYVPISTFRRLWGSRRSVTIQVEAATMAQLEAAQDQARVAMRVKRHLEYQDADDFSIETGESVMDLWKSATGGIYFVTIVVTGISLLVGGIVVMNIMLVSVTERIREIGVRRALGARRGDIRNQFMVESVILSAFGGATGVVAAMAFSLFLAKVLGGIMSVNFTAPVRLWAILVAMGVSSAVGLVAGIYPASRAAALDPVTALRSE